MSNHIDGLAARVAAELDSHKGHPMEGDWSHLIAGWLKPLLWDIDAEAWERGVMWKGGLGTFPPERPANPYRGGSDD